MALLMRSSQQPHASQQQPAQQQPAAASHVKFLFSRVTHFMTNNFIINPVFA